MRLELNGDDIQELTQKLMDLHMNNTNSYGEDLD